MINLSEYNITFSTLSIEKMAIFIYCNSMKTVWDLDKKAGRELKKFENRTDKSFKVVTLITQLS